MNENLTPSLESKTREIGILEERIADLEQQVSRLSYGCRALTQENIRLVERNQKLFHQIRCLGKSISELNMLEDTDFVHLE